jgi:hypothetical protein
LGQFEKIPGMRDIQEKGLEMKKEINPNDFYWHVYDGTDQTLPERSYQTTWRQNQDGEFIDHSRHVLIRIFDKGNYWFLEGEYDFISKSWRTVSCGAGCWYYDLNLGDMWTYTHEDE